MARFDPAEQAYRRRRLERDERLEQQGNRCDALEKQIEDLDRELCGRQSAREAMLARLEDIRPEKLGGLDEST